MSIFDGLCPSILSNGGKSASYEEKSGWKGCFFPARVHILTFVIYRALFLVCTLSWRVYNYVFRQGKGINRKNESTDKEDFLTLGSTDDNTQYCYFDY